MYRDWSNFSTEVTEHNLRSSVDIRHQRYLVTFNCWAGGSRRCLGNGGQNFLIANFITDPIDSALDARICLDEITDAETLHCG